MLPLHDDGRELENKFQGELCLPVGAAADLSRVRVGDSLASDPKIRVNRWCPVDYRAFRRRGCGDALDRVAYPSTGVLEIRVVKEVENIRPELHRQPVSNRKVLHSREVELEVAWPSQRVAPDVSECDTRSAFVGWFDFEGIDVVAGIWPTMIRKP